MLDEWGGGSDWPRLPCICPVPYLHPGAGFSLVITFLLVSSSNASKLWLVRSLGEGEYERLLLTSARNTTRGFALKCVRLSGMFLAIAGLLFTFVGGGTRTWTGYGGIGMVLFALVITVYGYAFIRRLHRRASGDAAVG